MLANCDVAVEEEEEPPKKASKKASKKVEINKAFFTALSKGVDVHSTSSLF
jgi:hypothetical protein